MKGLEAMKRNKRLIALVCSIAAAATLSACGNDAHESSEESETNLMQSESTAESEISAPESKPAAIDTILGEERTEYNDALDLSDYPLTKSDVPEDFSLIVEAESGTLIGSAAVKELSEASGGKFVNGVNVEGDELKLSITLEYNGFYDLNLKTKSSNYKVNSLAVDGMNVGDITTYPTETFADTVVGSIYLEAGTHEISVTPIWGYIDIDQLIVSAAANSITDDVYKVTAPLVNPNADENTRRLYKFLCDIYGKYSLSGQYADNGRYSNEHLRIKEHTGKSFALLGMDMGNYSLGSVSHGTKSMTLEYAYDWYNNSGGIVQLCWHWTSPDGYAIEEGDQHWWRSFYKEASLLDLDKIMNGEDEKGYQLLMDDIDNMSAQLARLRDAGVPVLWRPLHEASGGWFWWGNCKPESYKKLWNVMFDKMTNEHNLTNLIWVWNGQDPEWYPGDETVDINGWDIYAGKHVDTSQSGRFADMTKIYGEKTKLIALTENGCVMDPDKVMRDNARWLFWGIWGGEFTVSNGALNDEYTSFELLTKVYNHERVLTLDELPDLKNYTLQ